MNQDAINQSEWNTPGNWSALTYRSRLDTRMIVPKRTGLGWTINFGNKKGMLLFVTLLALPFALAAVITCAASHWAAN